MRKGIPALLAIFLAAQRVLAAEPGPPQARRAILISIDCLSQREFAEVVEPASGRNVPGLRALVADSASFGFAHAHSPWTTPSHVSMLTGLYPSQHGWNLPHYAILEEGRKSGLLGRFSTLADRLEAAGIAATASTGAGAIAARFGLGQGFRSYREHSRSKNVLVKAGPWKLFPDAPDVWRSAARDLATLGRSRFFMFVHSYDYHSGPGDLMVQDYEIGMARREHLEILEWIDKELITPLLAELRARDLYRDSLIILTGDHGSNVLRRDRKLIHRGLGHYEENLHVPLVVKFPRGWSAGRRSDALARHVDILPTVLASLGVGLRDHRGDGQPLADVLLSHAPTDVVSWSESDGHTFPRQSLIVGRHKYIRMSNETRVLAYLLKPPYAQSLGDLDYLRRHYAFPPRDEELYDLSADPWETENLASRSANQQLLLTLRGRMNQLVAGFPRIRDDEVDRVQRIDPKILEALRALGYIK